MPQQPERANLPSHLILAQEIKLSVPERVQAEDAPKLATFRMEAYTGGKMDVGGWWLPVVIDMEGIQGANKQRPIFLNHDATQIVGHSHRAAVDRGIFVVEGVISGAGPAAAEVLASAANGFPWQASVGLIAKKVRELKEGETATVNGQEVTGPAYLIRRSVFKETSFVPLGADDNTSASVAAQAGQDNSDPELEGLIMNGATAPAGTPIAAATPPAPAAAPILAEDPVKAARAEHARVAAINRLCAGAPEIAEQAITEGWSAEKAELHALKAQQVRASQNSRVISPVAPQANADETLAALKATAQASYIPEAKLLARYGEKVLDQAHSLRRLGLKELVSLCCAIDGMPAPKPGCSEVDYVRATFSSVSFAALLTDSANKIMLESYAAVPSVASRVARILNAKDFKTHTGVRLTGDLTYKLVEDGGEVKHGTLGDDSFTFKVDTYARMLGLTRKDLANDDLGAFLDMARMFGRGAGLCRESLFWTLVLANTGNFFHANNSNYITGAATVLAIAGLSTAVQTLEEQTDKDGNPIAISGKYLVVPPALKATAQQLYVSTNLTGGSSATLTANIHAGAYEPLSTAYLKAAAQAKVWYLFADPADVAAFGIAYLNGVSEPTVEEVAVSGEYLGRAWRGLLDVGVCQIDPRGAVKSKGEA